EAFLHSHDREPALTNPSLRLRLQKPRQTRRLEERASLWGPGSASESPPECPHRLGPLQAGLARMRPGPSTGSALARIQGREARGIHHEAEKVIPRGALAATDKGAMPFQYAPGHEQCSVS